MPAPDLTPAERTDIAEFLAWLPANRDRVEAAEQVKSGGVVWSEVPWWEF